LSGNQRDLVIVDPRRLKTPIVGRVVGKGLADEMGEAGYLVLDSLDGRAHHVLLPTSTQLVDLPMQSIVEVGENLGGMRADSNIVAHAKDGSYRPTAHAASLRLAGMSEAESSEVVSMHVRRLEALRRAHIVDREPGGLWRIPPDYEQLARRFDRQRDHGVVVQVRSFVPVDKQVRAIAATWLDRQLLQNDRQIAPQGFGAEVRNALSKRAEFLVENGFASRQGQRLVLMRDLLSTLRDRELTAAGRALEQRVGSAYRAPADGSRITGIYRRDVNLISGRFVMLEQAQSFTLVPWRPVLGARLGQSLSGVVRRDGVSWDFGRSRGPAVD
jgi:Protein of unknown function (DUF3363)